MGVFILNAYIYVQSVGFRALQTQLMIENVTSSDAGVWQCRLNTEHGAEKRLKLNVIVLDVTVIRCPEYTVTTSKGTESIDKSKM